jgi:hypothetical protein
VNGSACGFEGGWLEFELLETTLLNGSLVGDKRDFFDTNVELFFNDVLDFESLLLLI